MNAPKPRRTYIGFEMTGQLIGDGERETDGKILRVGTLNPYEAQYLVGLSDEELGQMIRGYLTALLDGNRMLRAHT